MYIINIIECGFSKKKIQKNSDLQERTSNIHNFILTITLTNET